MFKIPFMGPFLQAIYPKFDEYLKQFASGPLSCVSVFHKYVSTVFSVSHLDRPVSYYSIDVGLTSV
jgi:hypothetical protein